MDVENYGIKLSMTGDAQVNKQFDVVAAKGEQSAARITSAFSKTAKSAVTEMTAAQRALAAQGVTLEQVMAGANGQVVKLAQSQEVAAKSAGVHGLQLGRLTQELGTFLGRLTGTNTAVTRLGAMLGGAVAGYGPMIALLVAVSAVGAAYDKLTESTRKAEEEQKKLNDALDDYLKKQGRPAGDIGAAVTGLVSTNQSLISQRNQYTTARDSLLSQGSIEQANSYNEKIIALNKTIDANAVKIGAARGEVDRLTNASHAHVNELALQVEKQEALNAAFNRGSYAVTRINLDYDHRLALLHNAAEYTGAELVAINKLTDAQYAASLTAAALANAEDELQKSMDGADKAGTKILETLKNTQAEWTLNAEKYKTTIALLKELNEVASQVSAIGARNKKATDEEDKARKEKLDKEKQYQQDLQNIWRSGISKIATDGLKSFQDFFEDVNQLFIKLLERMEREGKAGGLAGKLLGIGAAATGGYSIGQASGSGVVGALGGAAAGFAIAGPLGALAGGIAGLTGGLIGGAAAAKQRKQAEDQLRDSLAQSLTKIRVSMGQLPEIAGQIADAQAQFAQRAQQINDAYAGKKNQSEREQLLAQNSTLEQQYIEWLKKQAEATKEATQAAKDAANETSHQNSHLRLLNATGQSDAAFQYQQSLELEKAIADGLSGIALSELIQAQWAEAAQREREKQTQILQDQLSAAQQAVDALQQVYDSLDQFSKSLNIGQYSPLSPRQKLDATRGQLGALYQAALGGDQQAAGQFSGVAQQFLDASRKYNASSAGYVLDFNSVSVMADALKSKFGAQLTDAQKQVSLLQQQLDALKSIDNGIQALVNRPGLTPTAPTPPIVGGGPRIEGASMDAQVFAAGSMEIVSAIADLKQAVADQSTDLRRGLERLAS